MALLDGTVVNVALRRIGTDLGASLAELQWITNGYLLALASLILLGGSLGDRYGRRRIFVIGVLWFTASSLLCAFALNPGQLIGARVLQGVGAALLTPGSLAMIEASFRREDRGRAIGAWSGLGAIAAAVGPLVGGLLVEYASWRLVFLLNLPIAAATVLITLRWVPETRDAESAHHFDVLGATLGVVGLGGITFALIEAGAAGQAMVLAAAAIGIVAMVAFVFAERAEKTPMLPVGLFRSRQFSAANGMTLLVYAALGAMTFFLVLQLQTVAGYGPLRAGLAMLPITIVMLMFAARGGALAARIGPRLPMTLGPIVCAAGIALLAGVDRDARYWFDIFPGVTVFSFGLALLVAPLTSTVLAAAPDRYAGIASGVNNAVARGGSLLAVAALPFTVGLSGDDYDKPDVLSVGYGRAMWICVVLLMLGGLVSYALIRNADLPTVTERVPA